MTPLDPLASRIADGLARIGPRLAPPPNAETTLHLDGGAQLRLPPNLPSARRLHAGQYEPEVTRTVRSVIHQGMTFVDVGANIGYYSLVALALVGPAGRVFAFEPAPDAFRYLALNIQHSGAKNAVAINKAVADATGTRRFVSSALEGGFLARQEWDTTLGPQGHEGWIDIQATSLDDYLWDQQWPAVDLVKIDAEGSEARVLRGMAETSRRNPALAVIMEVNLQAMRRSGDTPGGVADILSDLGFRAGYVIEHSLRPIRLDRQLPESGLIYNLLLTRRQSGD